MIFKQKLLYSQCRKFQSSQTKRQSLANSEKSNSRYQDIRTQEQTDSHMLMNICEHQRNHDNMLEINVAV